MALLRHGRIGSFSELQEYIGSDGFAADFANTPAEYRGTLMRAFTRAERRCRERMPVPKPGSKKVDWTTGDAADRYRRAWERFGGDVPAIAHTLKMTIGAVKRARGRYLRPEQWRKAA